MAAKRSARRGARPKEARPNIVIIVADDLSYADLSCYGRNDYQTPRLDRLATEGTRFTNAYAAAPVCTPSRVALMTGRYPARCTVGLLEPLTKGAYPDIALPVEHPTLSSLLKAGGYETALIGKWHLGYLPEASPRRHGFEHFFGILDSSADYISHVDPQGDEGLYENEAVVQRPGYLTDLFTEAAVAYVSRRRRRPFFLSVQYTAPHWPWQAPGDAPYPDSDSWTSGGSPETYAAMVQRLDEGVGAIVEALDRHDLSRNTLVIFTSDNGGERYSDLGPFVGRKFELWEGGLRVPAIVRWPGVVPSDAQVDQVAITMDWTATILAAAGTAPARKYPLDGLDLLPIIKGKRRVQPRVLAWRTFQRTRHDALRDGDWKYFRDGQGEYLLHLPDDPGETRDVSQSHPDRFADMRRKYAAWDAQMLPPVVVVR
jgi:arylsulfatase A-like enzyme